MTPIVKHRRAFTLVELLVVIGIIALLISILLPALNAARTRARISAGMANHKQLGIAFATYSSDAKGFFCAATLRDSSGATVENYATILVNGNYVKAPNQASSPVGSQGNSVFRCPSGINEQAINSTPINATDSEGQRFWRQVSGSTGIVIDTWFAINYSDWTDRVPARRIAQNSDGVTWNRAWARVSQLGKNQASMVNLFDGVNGINLSSSCPAGFTASYEGAASPWRLTARHGNKFANLLFYDGHVESWDRMQLPLDDWSTVRGSAANSTGAVGAFNTKNYHPRWFTLID